MRRGNITAGLIGGALGAVGTIGAISAVALTDRKLRKDVAHRFEDIKEEGERLFNKFSPVVKKQIANRRKATLKTVRRLRKRAE